MNIHDPNCKVCNSGFRKDVDDLLAQSKTFASVARWLSEKTEAEYSRTNVWNHNKNHRLAVKAGKRGIILQDTNGKSIQPTQEQLQSLSSFLDLIIEKTFVAVQSGDLVPTVTEAVKAAEVKTKLNEGSKYETELITLFMKMSSNANHS